MLEFETPVEIEAMCFAQFGKMYRSGGRIKAEDHEESEDDYEIDMVIPENEKKFHYMMTFDRNKSKLPDVIVLSNNAKKELPCCPKVQ